MVSPAMYQYVSPFSTQKHAVGGDERGDTQRRYHNAVQEPDDAAASKPAE